jgi:CDP-diacylglycerol--glycerol-3-phosphate 3-phosphatidyltransferase
MVPVDAYASAAVLLALAAGAAAYAVRVLRVGRAHYARTDAAGGSRLLSKGLKEMGYSWLQPVGRLCVRLGVHPDALTGASLVLALLSGVALADGHFGIAALLVGLSALGDVLDGMVARATGRAGPKGALFDASADRYGEFFFLAGLVLHWSQDRALLALPLAALLGSYMVSYGSAKAEALRVKVPGGSMRRAERAVWLCGGALLTPLWVAGLDRAGYGPALTQPLLAEAPLLFSVGLVALVSNVSAVLRLQEVGQAAAAGAPTVAAAAPLAQAPVAALPAAPVFVAAPVGPALAASALLASGPLLASPLAPAPLLAAVAALAGGLPEPKAPARARGEPEGAVARGRAAAKDSSV